MHRFHEVLICILLCNLRAQILWATAYGYFLFGEKLERSTALGAGIIIASGLYILMRESRARPDGKKPVLRTTTLRFEFAGRPRIGDIFRLRRGSPAEAKED